MSELANRALFDQEHTTLDFKREQYATGGHPELLKDIIAMANADASGERHIFIGIVQNRATGKNDVVGVDPATLVDDATYQQLVGENVEPSLSIRYETLLLEGKTVAVFRIGPCENQPYLLKKENRSYPKGTGWVRRGSSTKLLDRGDLDRMFAARSARTHPSAVRVLFETVPPGTELCVAVPDLSELPSMIEVARIRAILERRDLLNQLGSASSSVLGAFDRSANLFASALRPLGALSYEDRSTGELRDMIDNAPTRFAENDRYYVLEETAHQIMLVIENAGTVALLGAVLEVTVECPESVEVAERVAHMPRGADPFGMHDLLVMPTINSPRYPSVTVAGATAHIRSTVASVLPGQVVYAFGLPIRIATGAQAHGALIPFRTRLLAQNLPRPIEAVLEVRVA